MRILAAIGALALLVLVSAAVYVSAGLYGAGADEPHWGMTASALEWARTRSVNRAVRDVPAPPNLEDAALVRKGAANYAEMCAQCHSAPGMRPSFLRQGLYPRPPDLTQATLAEGPAFWTIKHGLKMTGMPAWGASHDDATIWALVAFIRQLPRMTAQQYDAMVRTAPREEAVPGGHSHGGAMQPAVPPRASAPVRNEP